MEGGKYQTVDSSQVFKMCSRSGEPLAWDFHFEQLPKLTVHCADSSPGSTVECEFPKLSF